MVSIGGDRATNADYRRANKEAVARSRKSKAEPKKERGQRVLRASRTGDRPRAQAAAPQQQQSPRATGRLKRPERRPDYEQFKTAQQIQSADRPRPNTGDRMGQLGLLDQAAQARKEGRPNVAPPEQTLTSQPGVAPAVPSPAPVRAAVPEMSEGVRELLNDRHWKLPSQGKKGKMPKSSFEKGGVTDLKEHDYRVSEEEWNRIKETYSSPEARAAGFIPPSPESADVDKNVPMMELDDQESVALTWEAYEALNDGQRAAVDFNTLLVDAREKDLSGKKIVLKGTEKTEYDKRVLAMFGAGRGADVVAPNTVNLLSELDMVQVGQDLDEYLSLERGIDTTELPDFKFTKSQLRSLDTLVNGEPAPAATPEQYAAVRTPLNMAALDTTAVQGAQTNIKEAMAKKDADTYNFETLMGIGTGPKAGSPGSIGYGMPDTKWKNPADASMDEWFRIGLEVLGSPDPAEYGVPAGTDVMEGLLAGLKLEPGYNTKTQQQFLDYVANKTSLIGQYGTKEDATMAALINKRAGMGG